MDLETTDIRRLLDAGYKMPELFRVKAADGITDLYGVMFKPFDFDPIAEISDHPLCLSGAADRKRPENFRSRRPEPMKPTSPWPSWVLS